jgi:hypothetical protein
MSSPERAMNASVLETQKGRFEKGWLRVHVYPGFICTISWRQSGVNGVSRMKGSWQRSTKPEIRNPNGDD